VIAHIEQSHCAQQKHGRHWSEFLDLYIAFGYPAGCHRRMDGSTQNPIKARHRPPRDIAPILAVLEDRSARIRSGP
jgi:hypothetical protein